MVGFSISMIRKRKGMTWMKKLAVLWTSDKAETALNMLLMYLHKSNVNRWWDQCDLITWGPSNKLVCENSEVNALVRELMDLGVRVYACQRCAEKYGLAEQLEAMGIVVKLMGEPLTTYLQDESYRILTI